MSGQPSLSKSARQHAEAVRAVGLGDAGAFGNVGEGAVTVVVIKDVLATLQSGRATGHHHSSCTDTARFRQRARSPDRGRCSWRRTGRACRRGRNPRRRSRCPSACRPGHSGFFADVGERAVTVVVVEHILAEIGDEQVLVAVVVVVADADALSPARVLEAGLER